MRCSPVLFLICFYPAAGWAQAQQQSLIDRLLRPNMDLQNSAQGKAFAVDSCGTTRAGAGREFVAEPSRKEKSFMGTRTIVVQEYHSRSFQSDSRNCGWLRRRAANIPGELAMPAASGVRQTRDAHWEIASRDFPGAGEFREPGKSQKSLDRQNPPLTIDQVRGLLNKNK
jgi:hypothetical protein